MSTGNGLLDAPGEVVQAPDLRLSRAKFFAQFLQATGTGIFASLREVRRIPSPAKEVVVFAVQVERPQVVKYDIRGEEVLAAVFTVEDDTYPDVLALREDFPLAPHVNLTDPELPRSLCLYDQTWAEVRLSWNPANFLLRIRYWLSKTSTGTLHGEDQPLEPLIAGSRARLILQSNFSALVDQQETRLFDIDCVNNKRGEETFVALTDAQALSTKVPFVASVFRCEPQTHGVIRRQPQDLAELHGLCAAAGLDLARELASKIREWHIAEHGPAILKSKLMLILVLPKTRTDKTAPETEEVRAFLIDESVEDIGERLGVIQKHSGRPGAVIGDWNIDVTKLKHFSVYLLQVHFALSPTGAAALNNAEECQKKLVGIGMGALGSQVFNNLIRAGFGRWVLVDSDLFLPHNAARHVLFGAAIGQNKATTIAAIANKILDGPPVAQAIAADFLIPGDQDAAITNTINNADLVLDFSASIAVSRKLAAARTATRNISAFLNPTGDSLIVAVEDAGRTTRLDWLEMLHYRAVLSELKLRRSLWSNDSRVRYCSGCRDLSVQLAQDDVSVWSGTASRAIKQLTQAESAALCIYIRDQDGSIAFFNPEIARLSNVSLNDWTIRLDEWLLEKLATFRNAKLPNETGGVLLGHFDTYRRACYLVDVMPSPPDSCEWPTTYVRGCSGLRESLLEVQKNTSGQICYVGEWHSHPKGASIHPSDADLQAYGWLVGLMLPEALPAIMLIIGDEKQFGFTRLTIENGN